MTTHAAHRGRPAHRWFARSTTRTVFASTVVALSVLAAVGVSAPPKGDVVALDVQHKPQSLASIVSPPAAPIVTRHDFGATAGYDTYIEGGTNHDWAKLVLLMGDFPLTDSNVTVVTRWMRQENYVDAWWTRNNPLNNGWGSGGGGGTGRYSTLVDAAENAAEALNTLGRYSEIVATLRASAPTAEVERAIWFSGWASGMYNNGQHWSYVDVPVITAPPSAWGR